MTDQARKLDLLLAEPGKGAVVRFRMGYEGTPTTYDYVALEVKGAWYLTGTEGAHSRSWEGLLKWIFSKGTLISMATATSWEDM